MGKYKKIVDEYLVNFQKESENFRTLYVQLNKNDEKDLIDRKNFLGHFTASAFVLSKNSKEVLMIHHKALKRYLQPGGHIEILDKSPLDAAKRELFEETGINFSSLEYKCFYSFHESVPFNISVHMIPENREKKEEAHYHYDLQYLFFCEEKPNIVINKDEARSYEWVSWDVFKKIPGYENVFRKIEKASKTMPETFGSLSNGVGKR